MVLAIDIGNSDIVLGGYENDTLRFTSRCGTDRRKTADEYALLFKGILELYNVSPRQIKGGIVASVVPSLRIIVQQAMERLTHATFLTLAAGRKTGLNIRLDWPTELGNDLVADAVAAVDRYPKPVIIMDLGTATAVLVVDKKGAYLGGMLHPGLRISLEALSASADQLPSIMLKEPERLIGRNTEECRQAQCTAVRPCWTGSSTGWRTSWGNQPRQSSPAGSPPSSPPTAGGRWWWMKICC